MVPWQLFDFLTEEQVKPLKSYIMARKKFLKKATYVALYVALYAVALIGMMVSVIIFNPIVVWVLALMAPKWVARMSYEKGIGAWDLITHIPFETNNWLWRVLPWRCRKHYMIYEFENFSKFSSKDRCECFLECYAGTLSIYGYHSSQDVFAKLNAEEKAKVFEKCKDFAIEQGEILTNEQFGKLNNQQICSYAKKHDGLDIEKFELLAKAKNKAAADVLEWLVFRYTPSFEQIEVLAENSLDDLLIRVIAAYGLAKGKVTELKNHISDTERWKKIELALRCNSQIKIVKSGKLDDWRHICETEDICIGTQYYMTDDHYDVFHQTGHQLHDRAVVSLLQSRNLGFAEKIFEFEPNNGLNSEDAKAIVESDPQLKLSLYKVRAKSKEANK